MADVVDDLRHGAEAECKCFRCRAADEIARLREFYEAWKVTSKSGSALDMAAASLRFSEALKTIESADGE